MLLKKKTLALAAPLVLANGIAFAAPFNGAADNQIDSMGYYYAISGGKFPAGQTVNGDNGSGGTFRYITDDPSWGFSTDTWHKDDWFSDNSGIAVTMRNGAAIVYDNNGLEPDAASAADPTFYNAVTGDYPNGGHGAVTAYAMSNNYDLVYSGYVKITAPTTVTSLTGYFAHNTNPGDPLTGGFDPSASGIHFRMNIWSNVDGDLLPANTGGFDGDVFTTDTASGAFAWSDTGFDRVGTSSQQDIYRLTYTLNEPITLNPGEYWFSHEADVPEPASIGIAIVAGAGLLARRRSM